MTPRAYYNEIDPFAAQWLRNLIAKGLIADGDVDERDIRDVQATDLAGYRQCHFFAGIGGWSYALRLAGWPDDHEVWTGSCPCQPFSVVGRASGVLDSRHLWPAFQSLIAVGKPSVCFGEQVASKDGREWLAGVRTDLEALGYAVGAADLCAAGVGAPHIRQRLYWVADANFSGCNIFGETRQKRTGRKKRFDRASSGTKGIPWGLGESRPEPLLDGLLPSRGRLCAYGNAIVPQVAAEFIAAYIESI